MAFGNRVEMPHSFRGGAKAAKPPSASVTGRSVLPVGDMGGSGGVDREVNSPARAEGGASPAPERQRHYHWDRKIHKFANILIFLIPLLTFTKKSGIINCNPKTD